MDEEGNPILPGTMSTNAVIMLLAGVVKFNSSLKNLTLANTGLETKAAGYFATALQENKVLEHLDLSGNPIEGAGIIDIAEAARTHPRLRASSFDGEALDLKLLRGGKSAETVIEFGDKMLGELSGHDRHRRQEQPHHATAHPQVEPARSSWPQRRRLRAGRGAAEGARPHAHRHRLGTARSHREPFRLDLPPRRRADGPPCRRERDGLPGLRPRAAVQAALAAHALAGEEPALEVPPS